MSLLKTTLPLVVLISLGAFASEKPFDTCAYLSKQKSSLQRELQTLTNELVKLSPNCEETGDQEKIDFLQSQIESLQSRLKEISRSQKDSCSEDKIP